MNFNQHQALREKIRRIYLYLEENLYLNRRDLDIRNHSCNSALLFSLTTALCQGKAMIVGEPGLGKTTSAEYVASLLFGLPLGTVWMSEISGHPEQTEEKIVGRPNLGRLNQGMETVVWSFFAMLPVKIVDEVNRLPETKQSLILDSIDRGKWEYLNESIVNEHFCLFATANYQDSSTHPLIPPLLDRFDVMIESRHPGPNLSYHVWKVQNNIECLRDPLREKDIHALLTDELPYSRKTELLKEHVYHFGQRLKQETGIEIPEENEKRAILEQAKNLEIDPDANAFLRLVLSELSFCYFFGQKRSHEECPDGCHFSGYLCRLIKNCGSNRIPLSVLKYARMLAWYTGDQKVEIEHVKTVLPFALAHRIQWKDEALSLWSDLRRSDPLSLFMAKKAVETLHRRYMELATALKDALSIACRIFEGEQRKPMEGDHPLFWEIKKDLEDNHP